MRLLVQLCETNAGTCGANVWSQVFDIPEKPLLGWEMAVTVPMPITVNAQWAQQHPFRLHVQVLDEDIRHNKMANQQNRPRREDRD